MNGDRSEPTFYANNFCQRLESMSPIGTHIPSTLISESQKLSHQLTAENGMKLTLSRPSSQRNECDIIAGDRSELRMSFLLSSIRFKFRRKNGWSAARNSRLYFIDSRVFNWYSLWAMGYGRSCLCFVLFIYLLPRSAEKQVHRQRAILRDCVRNVHGAEIEIDFRFIVGRYLCVYFGGHRPAEMLFYVLLDASIRKALLKNAEVLEENGSGVFNSDWAATVSLCHSNYPPKFRQFFTCHLQFYSFGNTVWLELLTCIAGWLVWTASKCGKSMKFICSAVSFLPFPFHLSLSLSLSFPIFNTTETTNYEYLRAAHPSSSLTNKQTKNRMSTTN